MARGDDPQQPVTAAPKEPVLAVVDIRATSFPASTPDTRALLGLRFDVDARPWLATVLPLISTPADLLVGQGDGRNRERAADLRDPKSGGAPARIATLTEWVTPTGHVVREAVLG